MLRPHPIIIAVVAVGLAHAASPSSPVNVRDLGAKGDGITNDTPVLQKAIDAASASGGGEIDFPQGIYRTGSLDLKSHVTLHLDQGAVIQGSPDENDYPLIRARWEGHDEECHRALISANHAEDIAITGTGIIRGDEKVGAHRKPRGPALIEPIESQNIRLEGVTLQSTRIWTFHPTYCQNVQVQNVKFDTIGINSDGIDPDSCKGVHIEGCSFTTGDDNIAIKSGKGAEGVQVGRPCEDITIKNCRFIKGYSSIALGSEVSGGIRNVSISECVFENGRAALYLKSRPGRGGFIENVTAENLTVGPEPLLEIESDYAHNPDTNGVEGPAGLTRFKDIQIKNAHIKGNRGVKVTGRPEMPVDTVRLINISGTCALPWTFKFARNVVLEDINVTGFKNGSLSLEETTGSGLVGSDHELSVSKNQCR